VKTCCIALLLVLLKKKKTKIIDKNCFERFSSNSWILAKSTLQGFFLPDYWESRLKWKIIITLKGKMKLSATIF